MDRTDANSPSFISAPCCSNRTLIGDLHNQYGWGLLSHFPQVRYFPRFHYSDVIMGAVVSQITSFTIVNSTVYSGADQRQHQSSASLVQEIHR